MSKCEECRMNYVQKSKSNGDVMLIKQCFVCGYTDKKFYKFSEVGGIDKVKLLPSLDDNLLEDFNRKQEEQRKEQSIERLKEFEEQRLKEHKEKREEFFKEYSVYLNSEKWRIKREAVLKRDNYKCKACEVNTATQVHHLTYQFIYDEPLFDLISVCKKCHDKIENLKLKKAGLI